VRVPSEVEMEGPADRLELTWTSKHLELRADGIDGYHWVDATTSPACDRINELGRVAAPAAGCDAEGLLLIGDALVGLRCLQREPSWVRDQGIRLVYIDPPFNTGQAFAQYADSLTHSVWLSMLRDRLEAVKPLLGPMASVWVHLDDVEQHRARCVLDEVFGPDAFVATIVWQKRTTRESRSAFSSNHDYIHVYAPAGPQRWKRSRNLLPNDVGALRNRDGDPRGPWADAPFTAPGYRANQHYDIVNPAGEVLRPPKGRSWFATQPVYEKLVEENRIWFPRDGAGLPRIKMFPEHLRGLVPFSLWGPDEAGTNDDAKRHLMAMFPELEAFATPKPEALLERIIHIGSDPGELVVDFFAGSGTTSAVAHKMQRRWITIERSPTTAAAFTAPRLARVVVGADAGGVTASTGWCGGGSFVVATVGDRAALPPEVCEALTNPEVGAAATAVRASAERNSDERAEPRALTLFDSEQAQTDVEVA
jgi:adenine-specific DNA-methyltransferase